MRWQISHALACFAGFLEDLVRFTYWKKLCQTSKVEHFRHSGTVSRRSRIRQFSPTNLDFKNLAIIEMTTLA
ncbi:MAG: hypothetical protein ACREBA_08110, partial [Nitrosotalea sp.]